MGQSHRDKAIVGVYWVVLTNALNVFIKLIITMILSRLLEPGEIGIVAAIMVVVGFGEIFWILGVGPAIVQKKQVTDDDLRTGSTLNMLFGLISYCLIFFFSRQIASFAGIENVLMLQVLSTVFLIHSLSAVSVASSVRYDGVNSRIRMA